MMPYTKPVITDPYFDKPVWIVNEIDRKEFICLSSESDDQEVELFLFFCLATMISMSINHFGYRSMNCLKKKKSLFRVESLSLKMRRNIFYQAAAVG